MVQHHRPAVRTRKRGDENAMKASRRCAAYRAGSITAKRIGDEPFASEQGFPAFLISCILGSIPRELARDAVENAPIRRVFSAAIEDRNVLSFGQAAS